MADCLMPFGRALVFLALSASTWSALAQVLADPTRPPAGLMSPVPDALGETGPVLQSVLIPRKGKAVAVIGGKQVRLGEMYGESRLIRLSEKEAVLEGAAGVERLLLTPGIEKTNIITKSPAARRAQGGGKP